VFLVAALALAGQAPRALPLLPAALQRPGEQVTYAQRALWRACAHGVYGETGTALIREWLTGPVRALDAEAAATEGSRWASAAAQTFKVKELAGQLGRELSFGLAGHDKLTGPLIAARELAARTR
jgi:hypothetical protein